jgi:hypothetical protein
MKKRIILMVTVVLIFASGYSVFSQDDIKKLDCFVIKLKGDVQALASGHSDWRVIWSNRLIKIGDKAKTASDSMAKIRFQIAGQDAVSVIMGSYTTVELTNLGLIDNFNELKLSLNNGKIRTKNFKDNPSAKKVEIQTLNAVVAARGTEFYVQQEPVQQQGQSLTKVAVFSDSVIITSTSNSSEVFAGQTATVDSAGIIIVNPPSFPFSVTGVSPDKLNTDEALMDPTITISTSIKPDQIFAPAPVMAPPIYNPGAQPSCSQSQSGSSQPSSPSCPPSSP